MIDYQEIITTRNNWLITGEGELVRFINKKITQNEQGITTWQFTILPSQKTIKKHNLTINPETGTTTTEYEDAYIFPLKETDKTTIYLTLTTLTGDDNTPSARKLKELSIKIREYQKENKILQSALAKKTQDMKQLLLNEETFIRTFVDKVRIIQESTQQRSPPDYEKTTDLEKEHQN